MGRPRSANPREFFACRVKRETMAEIKRRTAASAGKLSEGQIVDEAFAPGAINLPDRVLCGAASTLPGDLPLRNGSPILRPRERKRRAKP